MMVSRAAVQTRLCLYLVANNSWGRGRFDFPSGASIKTHAVFAQLGAVFRFFVLLDPIHNVQGRSFAMATTTFKLDLNPTFGGQLARSYP